MVINMKHLILLCALLISFNSFADELVDVNKKKPVVTDGGWKSIANWEQLAIGIKPSAVRKILGEPQKIDGGILVIWHYKRGGRVVFQVGKVFSWNKPDQ